MLIISLIDYFQGRNLRGRSTRRVGAISTSLSSPLSRGRKTKLAGANFRGNWLRPNSPSPLPLSPLFNSTIPPALLALCALYYLNAIYGCAWLANASAKRRLIMSFKQYKFQGKQFPSTSSFMRIDFIFFSFLFLFFLLVLRRWIP